MRVTLSVPQVPLEVGVPTTLVVTVRNVGTRDVRWITDGCGSPVDVYAPLVGENWIGGIAQTGIRAEFKAFALEPRGHAGYSPLIVGFDDPLIPDGIGCADLGIGYVLKAGTSLKRELLWTGGTVIAPDGPIEILASFRYAGHVGDSEDGRYAPIETRLESWLVSDYEVVYLPPGPAIDAALADERFRSWLEAAPSSTWSNTHHVFGGDRWTIGLFRDSPAGFYGAVTMDARTGEAVSYRFE